MTPATLVLAGSLAVAAGLLVPRSVVGESPAGRVPSVRPVAREWPPRRTGARRPWVRWAVALGAGLLPVAAVGEVGLVLGVPVAVLTWRALDAGPNAHERRRADALARELPHVVDLLAVAVRAGLSLEVALSRTAAALPAPVAGELDRVASALRLGVSPRRAWGRLPSVAGWDVLARTMTRSSEGGVPVVVALETLAGELRSADRQRGEAAARSVGVRAAAPLGLCLLPAFVLVGVVPLVVGLSGLLTQR